MRCRTQQELLLNAPWRLSLSPTHIPTPCAANLKQSKTKPLLCFGAINCRALICQQAGNQLAVPKPGSCGLALVWGRGAHGCAAPRVSLRMLPLLGHKIKSPCGHRARKDGISTWEPGRGVKWLELRWGVVEELARKRLIIGLITSLHPFLDASSRKPSQLSSSEILLTWDLGYQETLK